MEMTKSELIQDVYIELKATNLDAEDISKIIATLEDASIRPLRVVWECIKNGSVSTETLQKKYGYNQPPRAARDVRELGFELQTKNGSTTDGRRMAIYNIANLSKFEKKVGRKAFKKSEKNELIKEQGNSCYFCCQKLMPNELQIDHKIPFEVAGNLEHSKFGVSALILLCASCNRSKSWSCEHCSNFKLKDVDICRGCYWCAPSNYHHVRTERRLIINRTFDNEDLDLDIVGKKSKAEIDAIILKALKNID